MFKFIYILFLLMVVGCAEANIVEETGFVHSIGIDLNHDRESQNDGEFVFTFAIPQIIPTAEKDTELLSTVAHSKKDARARISRRSDRRIVGGQLRTTLFSEEVAEQGIIDKIDGLKRDHHIGLNVQIITVEGEAKEILMTEFPMHRRTSRYIYGLIEKESRMNVVVETTLYRFLREYFDDGIDPITPLIKLGKDDLIIDGICLYKEDRKVGKIAPQDARIFMMMHGDYVGGYTMIRASPGEIENEEEDTILLLTTIDSARKIHVKSPHEITVEIDIHGGIDEYTGTLDLAADENQLAVEAFATKWLTQKSEKIIKEMQQVGADALGIGKFVRNSMSYAEWKALNWKETVYPNAEISVKVNLKAKGFGAIK